MKTKNDWKNKKDIADFLYGSADTGISPVNFFTESDIEQQKISSNSANRNTNKQIIQWGVRL